ncbi:serine/threonine-protein kinase D3-like isoform X2 [Corticium candelabrum]|uniref:serine/threonine-protein kinase D3-like isoform X2 n=1 Tax=Corticium candelabrum TaxID=121492 RepID=UPI002E265C3B|nr:serine/threonine-protein kinase D3-like isoform X2 [Corticium candelabrum]
MAERGIRLTFQCGLCKEQVQVNSMEMRALYDQAFHFLERQYPDNVTKYIDLQDNIILMVHKGESMQTETMEIVTDVSSLKMGDLVEIVVSGHVHEMNTNIRPHMLFVHSYKSPTFCDFCGEMLWGLVRQGVKCDGCGCNYHKRCAYRIPNNCSRKREQMRRQSVAATTTPNLPSQVDIVSILESAKVRPNQLTGPGGNYVARPIEIDIFMRPHIKKVVPHRFATHTYKTPTVCMYCKKLLVGVVRQGKKCKDCKYNVHKSCERYVDMHCERQIQDNLRHDSDSLIVENPVLAKDPASLQNSGGATIVEKVVHVDVHVDDHEQRERASSEEELKENGTEQKQEVESPDIDDSASDSSSLADVSSQRLKTDTSTVFIPLTRVCQSVRTTKRFLNKVLKEGPLSHFTNVDPNRKTHWWCLDTKNLCLYKDNQSTHPTLILPLSEILAIEYSIDTPAAKHNWTPHCFTMRTAITMYYVGENKRQTGSWDASRLSFDSVAGTQETMSSTQVAESWEEAIHQALRPVAPRSSGSIKRRSGSESKQHATSGRAGQEVVEETTVEEVKEEEEDIAQRYQLFTNEILGSGQFGIVYAGVQRLSGKEVAVKVIDKSRFPTKQETALKNEVAILELLVHPGIVTVAEMFETSERVFVVMEKMKNDMLEMILNNRKPKGRLPERVTKFITFQVLTAMKFLHTKNIVHCDLKPENVLLASESSMPQVKICDFGFARIIGEKSFRNSVVGTPAYLAPEVLKSRPYNRSLDMWSVGVIVYVSLSGTFPFSEDEEIADQIQNAAFMYPANPWAEISREAIDLIGKLLRVDQRRRYTVARAGNHIWFQTREAWDDLRRLEAQVGQRYLTDEKLDSYWLQQSTNPVGHNPIDDHPVVTNGSHSLTTGKNETETASSRAETKKQNKPVKSKRDAFKASKKYKTVSEGLAVPTGDDDSHAEEVERRLSKLGYQVSPL